MKYLKSFNELNYNPINESVSDLLYHFTYVSRTIEMLDSNEINLTPVFGTSSDNEINKGKLYSLSLTSSRHSDIGYAQSLPKKDLVRITFDGRKLTQKNKSVRVDYWQRPKDPKDPMYNPYYGTKEGESEMFRGKSFYKNISRQDELEDRIITDNDTIPNASEYIISIEVLNSMEKERIETLKWYCDKHDIPFHYYEEQKYFDANKTNKSIPVEAEKHDMESHTRDSFFFDELLCFYLLKNEEKIDSTLNELSKIKDIDIDDYKEKLLSKIKDKSYKLYYGSYYFDDFVASLSNHIHNSKRSTDKATRWVIRKIGMDMKKNNAYNIKEYINKKLYKGKKTQQDFNEELNSKIMSVIDEAYKKEEEDSKYNSVYDMENTYSGFFDFQPFKEFIDNKTNEIKKYISDYVLNNNDMFKYSYVLSNTEVNDKLNIKEDSPEVLKIVDLLEDVHPSEVIRPLKMITWAIDDFYYDEVKRIQEENTEQWKN
jgi:hypothetical protein